MECLMCYCLIKESVDGAEVRQMCDELGIEKRHSAPYHPEGDGEAERTMQSYRAMSVMKTDQVKRGQNFPDQVHIILL